MTVNSQGQWNSVSEEYRYGLRDLTFNSKPIINNLTLFAQDHVQAAPALARVLTDHLVMCPSEYKLPALYLIDSIVKNIGDPYVSLLCALLPTAFPEAFRQLRDERVRRDFGRTLETWWGLFPSPLLQAIQQRTFGQASTGQPATALGPRKTSTEPPLAMERSVRPRADVHHPPLAQFHQHQFAPYVPQYPLSDLLVRIISDLRAAMRVPPERYNEKYVADIMHRLEYECRHQHPGDPSLFRALDERARIPDKRPLIDLIDLLIAYTRHHQPMMMTNPEARHHLHPTARGTSHVGIHGAPNSAVSKSPPIMGVPSVPSAPEFSAAPTVTLPDVSPLLASLSSLPIFNMKSPNITTDNNLAVRPVYEEIMRRRPNAHAVLYEALPRQCTNCGLRFPDTSEGQSKLHAHLDAHFRRNIRLKDKGKKVMARIWLPPEQDWVRSVEAGDTERPVALFSNANAANVPAALGNGDILNQKTPMIPAGSDHTSRVCHLCQEPINIVWDDEADEWMYKDAIYHATKDSDSKEIIHASCAGK